MRTNLAYQTLAYGTWLPQPASHVQNNGGLLRCHGKGLHPGGRQLRSTVSTFPTQVNTFLLATIGFRSTGMGSPAALAACRMTSEAFPANTASIPNGAFSCRKDAPSYPMNAPAKLITKR